MDTAHRRALALFVASAAALLGATEARAQAPEGYFFGPRVEPPDSLVEGEDSSRFTIRVDRRARDDFERELIRRAERLYATPERIAAAGVDAYAASHCDRLLVYLRVDRAHPRRDGPGNRSRGRPQPGSCP